mgnify:CR=1 FL=1
MIYVTVVSSLNEVIVHNVSQRISARAIKCSKQILSLELSLIVFSASVSFHGCKAFSGDTGKTVLILRKLG